MFEILDNYVKIGGGRYKKAGLEWQEFGPDSVIFTRDGVLVGPGPVRYDAVTDPDTSAAFVDMATFTTYLDANFFEATGGAGGGPFTELTGAAYKGGTRYKVLSGPDPITLANTASKGGVIHLYNTGAATSITVGATVLDINDVGTNEGFTAIGIMISNGFYSYTVDLEAVIEEIPAPDTTPPTVSTRVTTSDTVIRATLDEACTGSSAGFSVKKGASIGAATNHAITGFSGSGTASFDFTVGSIVQGDGLWMSYDADEGDTMDLAGNPLASFTDQVVTNNVSSLTVLLNKAFTSTLTPATSLLVGAATAAIANDGGVNKLKLNHPVGVGDLARMVLTDIHAVGDIIYITLTGVTLSGATIRQLIVGPAAEYTTSLLAGTNTYGPIDTAGHSGAEIWIQPQPNNISTVFVGEIKVEKEP